MKRKTNEIFINESNIKHKNFYDYSLVQYKNNRTDVKIICPIHGSFDQRPSNHLKGHGCPDCSGTKKLTIQSFKRKANLRYKNKFMYDIDGITSNKQYIKIICPEHGEFTQRIDHHLRGDGCSKCSNNYKYTTEDFIKKIKELNDYDYSDFEYINAHKKSTVICKKHGEFQIRPNDLLNGHGCPNCRNSKGENRILNFLKKNKIKFIKEKKYKDCKNKNILPFDFYLPDYNMCIEFDGIQHFQAIEKWGGLEKLKYIKTNDKIKTEYCKKNNINLLRVKYSEKNIEEILKNNLLNNAKL
jgi:hypothetical protein